MRKPLNTHTHTLAHISIKIYIIVYKHFPRVFCTFDIYKKKVRRDNLQPFSMPKNECDEGSSHKYVSRFEKSISTPINRHLDSRKNLYIKSLYKKKMKNNKYTEKRQFLQSRFLKIKSF